MKELFVHILITEQEIENIILKKGYLIIIKDKQD